MYCPNCGSENRDVSKFCTGCGQPLAAPSASQPQVTAIIPPAPSSAPATPPPQISAGRTAMLGTQTVLHGRYLIVKLLAQGGMGAAYLGQDQSTFGRQVVIKEMLANYTTPQEKLDAERNFAREGQVLASLNHPGIPQINDYFIEQDKYYLVMTLAQGENLEDRLEAAGGRLPEKDVIDYGLQIANILVYLAALQPPVIHRDIKPANIILTKQTGRVTLVDFGLAKAKPGTGVMNAPTLGGVIQSTPMGTPGYAPPEQYQGRTDSRSDVYALAATMHHLLTGSDPRQAPVPFTFVPIISVLPNAAPALDSLLRRALEPNPAGRPTAQQMESDLKNLSTPSVVKPVSPGPFHFRNGDTANNVDELAQKAEQYWDDGAYHLTQGHFEPWLRAQNRHDLATVAERIRVRGGDASAGLEELLRALNPQLQPPALAISSTLLDFGVVTKGETREQDFQITNRGRGYLYGTLKSSVPWLSVSATNVACKSQQTQSIKLKLDTRTMKEGPHARPVLDIDTNGGRQAVAAQTEIAWAPALSLAPSDRLNFGDVLVHTGASAARPLTITNSGGGTLRGQVTAHGGWFDFAAQDFTVPSGQKVELRATANTGGLVVGIYDGQVNITSNVGDMVLPAQIGISKALYAMPTRAMRWGFFAAFAFVALFACSLTTSLGARGILGIAPINYFASAYLDLLRRFSNYDFNLASNLGLVTLLIFGLIGLIAYGASRTLIRSLDEIEDYYHGGSLAQEISPDHFAAWRYFVIMGLFAFCGIAIGVRFDTATANDWLGWGLLIGPLAGIFIGGGLTVSGARINGIVNTSARLSAFERIFFVTGGMATWGILLNATRGNRDWFAPFVWAVAGFVLTSASFKLPARLQWIIGILRPSLIIAFFGYIVEAEIYALISFFAYGRAYFPSFDAYYGAFPGVTGFDRVVVDVILLLAILAGGAVGLIAVNDASLQRKQIAQTVGLALFPALLLGCLGMIVGGSVFFVLTLGHGWGFGAMLVTALVIAAGLAAFRWQSSRLERGELVIKNGLARLLKNRPLPNWVNRFSLVALARDLSPIAIGVTATIATLLLPFVIQTALSLLIVLLCLAALAVGAGVVVFVVVFAARTQSGKLPRMP